MEVDLVIPVWNEAEALELLLPEVPHHLLRQVIVVDGGSGDGTREVATRHGAKVIVQSGPGYGRACHDGFLATAGADVVAYLDGDYSDPPAALPDVLAPVLSGQADVVLGSRTRGSREPGALMPQQQIGNLLVLTLLLIKTGRRFSDLGSFKAIRRDMLERLGMQEMRYGWTVEMVAKSVRSGYRVVEVPVGVRRRIGGHSKVSGTLRGTVGAGYELLRTAMRYG